MDIIESEISDLYEIVEVQKLQLVPSAVAADALRLVNPDLAADEVAKIIKDNDGLGSGGLRHRELQTVVRYAIRNFDLADASKLLRDLVFRMRVAFRRRYLMYDASPNIAPEFLFENITTANHYRIVFDAIAKGADWITRHQLKDLLNKLLPDNKVAAANSGKAAMGPDDRPNSIGFAEFAMVLHPVTQQIPLSTLVTRAEAISRSDSAAPKAQRPGAWLEEAREREGARSGRATPSTTATNVRAEMAAFRLESDAAEAKVTAILGPQESRRSVFGSKYAVAAASASPARGLSVAEMAYYPSSPSKDQTGEAAPKPAEVSIARDREARISKLEEELARSQLEIANLKRNLHSATIANAATNQRSDKNKMLSSQAAGDLSKSNERQLLDDPFYRINKLEKELKEAKVRLSVATDSTDLYNLLMRSSSTQPLARFYTDEKALLAKHEYLKSVSDIIDPQSPQMVMLTQYELLVCSYQALYRAASDRARAAEAGLGSGGTGVSSFSHPGGRRSPSTGARNRSPSLGSAATRHVNGTALKWSELDRPVSQEHWKTRTLGDPTLTEEERNALRQRLATQMRSAARTKSPHLKVKHVNPNMHYSSRASSVSASRSSVGRATTPVQNKRAGGAEVELVNHNLTSQEAMLRLQNLSQIAAKQRFL